MKTMKSKIKQLFAPSVRMAATFLICAAMQGAFADDALSTLTPAYHFAFDGDCTQASGDSETISWGGENTSDATYFSATKTGGQAIKFVKGKSTPYASSFSFGTGDWTALCSAKISSLDNGTLWCIGNNGGAYALSSRGLGKVSFSRRAGTTYDGEVVASVGGELCSFHTYAVVYHSSTAMADFYVDGVFVGTTVALASVGSSGSADFQIGSTNGKNDYTAANSLMDDWRLYKTALTEAQIAEYAAEFPVQNVKADYKWIATESGIWSDGANWQSVADGTTGTEPGASHLVEIPAGSDIVLTGSTYVKEIDISGSGEASFTANADNKWHQLRADKIGGSGTMVLKSWWSSDNVRAAVGLESAANNPIYCGVPVVIRDMNGSTGQDSWFKGYSGGTVYLLNDVTIETGYNLAYQYVEYHGDLVVKSKFQSNASTTIAGKLIVSDGATVNLSSADSKITGTLVAAGPASVSLNNATCLASKVELEENMTLRLMQGLLLEKVTFAEGSKLFIAVSDAESAAITITDVELPDGADLADYLVAASSTGARTPYTISRDATTGVVTASAGETAETTDPVTTTWIGGVATDWWNNSNWTLGRPYEKDTAIIPVDLTIVPGDITISNLVIAAGKTLFIKRSSGWPTLRVYETNGGTIKLSCNGLKPQTSVGSEGADIRSDVVVDPTSAGANQDCWIEGNSADSPLNLYGTLYATNSAFRVNQGMNVYGKIICGYTSDDDNYFRNSVVKSGGEICTVDGGFVTVEHTSTIEEGGKVNAVGGTLKLNGGITVAGEITGEANGTISFGGGATVNGNITGSPIILANGSSGNINLNGDNSDFAGVVTNRTYNQILLFNNVNAGSAKAKWTIYGDARSNLSSGTLKFGELNYYKDGWCVFYFPDDAEATVEIGELGTDSSFAEAGDCWFGKSSHNNQTPNITLIKKGAGNVDFGMNQIQSLVIEGGTVSMTSDKFPLAVAFAGGTLAYKSDSAVNTTDRSSVFSQSNTSPIKIDTVGHDMTMATALTTTAGIVKEGEGTLTLTAMPSCSGVTVNGGSLVLPIDTSVDLGTIAVAEGATLQVDGSGLTVTENTPVEILNGSADNATLGRIDVAGQDWSWAASIDGTTISANPTAWGDVPNVWVGGAQGYWKTAANWSRNIAPQSTHQVVFNDDAFVWIEDYKNIGELVVNGTVEFRNTTGHPQIELTGATGNGKIQLWHVGLAPNGQDADIASTLTLEYLKVENANTTDSWLGGKGQILNIYAPIIGAGFIRMYDKTRLYGDNSGFTGRVRKDDADVRFMTPESSFPNATKIEIYGTLWLWFDEGTFSLGGNVEMRASGNRGINMPADAATSENGVTLVLGGGNGNITLSEGNSKEYRFYTQNGSGWTEGCANAKVRKIGTGTMTNRIIDTYNFSAEGGTTHFTADSSAVVTVAEGAAVGGTGTVGSLKFEPGAIIAPTVTYHAAVEAVKDDPETTDVDETVAAQAAYSEITKLTAATINASGVIVRLDDDSITAINTLAPENTTVLSATTTLSGVPVRLAQDSTNAVVSAGEDTVWLAKKDGNDVKLVAGSQTPGFIIIIAKGEGGAEDVTNTVASTQLTEWMATQGYSMSDENEITTAQTALNTQNGNSITGFEAYILGYDNIADANPILDAAISDETITFSFAGTSPRLEGAVAVSYSIESSDSPTSGWSANANANGTSVTFDNAGLYNRLVATISAVSND